MKDPSSLICGEWIMEIRLFPFIWVSCMSTSPAYLTRRTGFSAWARVLGLMWDFIMGQALLLGLPLNHLLSLALGLAFWASPMLF